MVVVSEAVRIAVIGAVIGPVTVACVMALTSKLVRAQGALQAVS